MFDRFYPSPSDPGAYVRVQRRGELLVYELGNHGWSTDWAKQSVELLAAWIEINLALDGLGTTATAQLTIEKALRSP